MKCKYCKRKLPNKAFKTKNGCPWCDEAWHDWKKNESKK